MAIRAEMRGLSICSGVDGIGLGLSIVVPGYRTVCHVERGAEAAAILATRMGEGALPQAPIWSDVATFDGRQWRGAVDIVTAGFPCQPFSAAGQRRGVEDERFIWPDIARVISECEPRLIILENSTGLISSGGLAFVLADLASIGIDAVWDVFRASDLGAPHQRARIFILGYRAVGDLPRVGWGQADMSCYSIAREPGSAIRMREFWPPGRKYEDWAGVDGENQPAIPGVDHGVAQWLERIRLTGASVVPQCVAMAFALLAGRAARKS